MRDRPFPPSAHDFATPGFTRAPSQPHETSRSQRYENPVYLINGLFSGSPENVVKMSPQRGTIDGLDALSAQVEVSSESESVCDFGGQKRFTGRERGAGIFFFNRAAIYFPLIFY